MSSVRSLFAAGLLAVLAFTSSAVFAQAASQAAPLRLNQFMNTKSPPKPATSPKTATSKKSPALAFQNPDDEAQEQVAAPASMTTGSAPAPSETDAVVVTSPDELNEIDAAADEVPVVNVDEVNEIDLAVNTVFHEEAKTSALNAMASADQPANKNWAIKLLAALGGIIAVASAARLLTA